MLRDIKMGAFDFDPERVAYFEAAGWRAYYDRNWFKLFRLIAALCHEQFRIPFPQSWLAAYLIARASAMWVPADHDQQAILRLHEKFYQLAKRYSGLEFDTRQAAMLEEQYWDIHRQLSGKSDKTAFIETLTEMHSLLFGVSREQARESAELRVEANNVVDTITAGTSTNPEADWMKLEDYLRQCYRSLRREMNAETVKQGVQPPIYTDARSETSPINGTMRSRSAGVLTSRPPRSTSAKE
jgi:hypothetical protein